MAEPLTLTPSACSRYRISCLYGQVKTRIVYAVNEKKRMSDRPAGRVRIQILDGDTMPEAASNVRSLRSISLKRPPASETHLTREDLLFQLEELLFPGRQPMKMKNCRESSFRFSSRSQRWCLHPAGRSYNTGAESVTNLYGAQEHSNHCIRGGCNLISIFRNPT
jgi:hypothetical protein